MRQIDAAAQQWKQHQQHRSVSRVEGESYDRNIGEQGYNTYNSSFIDRNSMKNSTQRCVSVLRQHGQWMGREIIIGKGNISPVV